MFKDIELIATDFDGIITDGFVYYSSESTEEFKRLSFKDIMGISVAVKNGYRVAIISGEKNQIIDKVAKKFNLTDVYQGIRDKKAVLFELSQKYSIPTDKILYLGDDINDIPVLENVGFPVTVPDCNVKVKNVPNIFITQAHGGSGAFREVVDLIVENRGSYV